MKWSLEFLIAPVSLVAPVLLACVLLACTVWSVVPIQSTLAQPSPAPAEEPRRLADVDQPLATTIDREPSSASLAQDQDLLVKKTQALRKDFDATERNRKAIRGEQQKVNAAIRTAERRIEDLKSGMGALEQKQNEIQTAVEENAETVRLASLGLTKKAELAALENELRNARSPIEREIVSLPHAAAATKMPILVELFHERAIPVDKKHFHFDIPKFSGPTLATRTDVGETADEIKNPTSSFEKFLKGIKPEKQYLSCLLNSDSFNIFREVRRLARAKGISVGWEPVDSSGGRITIYPVHFVKGTATPKPEKEKELPRVAPIIE